MEMSKVSYGHQKEREKKKFHKFIDTTGKNFLPNSGTPSIFNKQAKLITKLKYFESSLGNLEE